MGPVADLRGLKRGDTVGDILAAPDRDAWLDWLRQRRKGLRKRALRATQRWLKLSSPW